MIKQIKIIGQKVLHVIQIYRFWGRGREFKRCEFEVGQKLEVWSYSWFYWETNAKKRSFAANNSFIKRDGLQKFSCPELFSKLFYFSFGSSVDLTTFAVRKNYCHG